MLRVLGIRLHPAVRFLLGAAALAIGIATDRIGLDIIGGLFIGWAVVGVFASAGSKRGVDEMPTRHFR